MKHLVRFALAAAVVALTFRAAAAVTFQLPARSVASPPVAVSVAGSFNNWNIGATPMLLGGTTWSAAVQLPDGRHFYKFVWRDQQDQTHWMNDPGNPFLADDGNFGSNNFLDVRNGARVELTDGLELFVWPRPRTRTVLSHQGDRVVPTIQRLADAPGVYPLPTYKWVGVGGDFNGWRLGQFSLVPCADGYWRAYIAVRRPFSYKLIADGRWYFDAGNEPAPELFIDPDGRTRSVFPQVIYRVPDGYGRSNSHRAQANMTSPALVAIERPVAAGNWRDLDEISSHALSCDYGRAVALARKVRAVNAQAGGASSDLVLQTLNLEAEIHRRWARMGEAAACWQAVMDSDRDTTVTRKATQELTAYHLYVTKNYPAARALSEWSLRRLQPGTPEAIAVLARYAATTLNEHRLAETLATVETALARLPSPVGASNDYRCAITELYLLKGYCHFHLKQWDQARAAFNKVIEIHPWDDSQNVQKARKWLGFVEQRKIDPYDPL